MESTDRRILIQHDVPLFFTTHIECIFVSKGNEVVGVLFALFVDWVEYNVGFTRSRYVDSMIFIVIKIDFEGETLGTELADERFPFEDNGCIDEVRVGGLVEPFLDAFDVDELGETRTCAGSN
jgi:hypothetical protein